VFWLNLGCGEYYAEDWTNVDWQSPHRADQQVDLCGDLPWEPGTVGRVYLGHVLEHLTVGLGVDLLTKLHKLAAPGCDVMVVGPDINRAQLMNQRGELSDQWVRLIREGGCRWPGDAHLWLCEPDTLQRMLQRAGWQSVREIPVWVVPDLWPVVDREQQWQCAVEAVA
jgi:predicted SAM-dependent methyltransferase